MNKSSSNDLKNVSTDLLVDELVRRGATLTENKTYGEYRLIKKILLWRTRSIFKGINIE